jgi:uncharacterized UBP type Zn finger protein
MATSQPKRPASMPAADHPQGDLDSLPPCDHVPATRPIKPHSDGCLKCLDGGKDWVALWLCLSCGWVACSDDSPNQHAKAHYQETDHPVTIPLEHEPGQRWCNVHQCTV